MVEATGASIAEHFAALDDPRIDRTKRHKLLDIVAIAICGTICGADSWVHIEMFGRSKEEWFKSFLELPNGIPSHDTFGDLFSRLDPEQFQSCLWGGPRRWPDWPKVKWWPLTVRRCAAPTTGPGASRPFTW